MAGSAERDRSERDLRLVCAEGATVDVNSATLLRETFSEAISDVIGLLQKQHPNANAESPIKWEVPQDKAPAWEVVWKMAKDPMSTAWAAGLTWDNLADVLQLVDKYAFSHVAYKVQVWVTTYAPGAPPGHFPHLSNVEAALRVLQLRETLIKCSLADMDKAIEQVMLQDMRASNNVSTYNANCSSCSASRNFTGAGICTTCHQSGSGSYRPAGKLSLAAAVMSYARGDILDRDAAIKVLASVGHMFAADAPSEL